MKVPILGVIQGWYADEYARCAEEMFGGHWPAVVGVGSVCRRQIHGPDGVLAIVRALDQVMPAESQLHLFGVKSGALAALAPYSHRVASVDSMAWDAAVRRTMPTGRTQAIRAEAMAGWHARQVQLLHQVRQQPVGEQRTLLSDIERERSAQEVALEAAGQALGDLFGSNDLSYPDVRWLTLENGGLVDVLLRMHGVQAFEEEEPADDFGLGIVYTAVRDALIEVGHLHPNEPLAPAPAC